MKRFTAQRHHSVLFLALFCLCACTEVLAQSVQYTNEQIDRGMRSTRRVNPTNLGLEFQLSLGQYRGRAGHDVPVTLSYSSKLWNMEFQGYVVGAPPPHQTFEPYTIITAEYGRHTVRGWTTPVDFPEFDTRPSNRIYNPDGSPNITGNCTAGCYKVDRMMVWLPDGSGHELRASDQPRLTTQAAPDNFYAVDGSRLRYQSSTATLFLPDGSRYVGGQHIDRNGNTVTVVSGGIRDTVDRTINNPLPWGHGSGPFSPVDQSYSLPAVGGAGATINYTFVWKYLGDVLTDPTQPLSHIANSGCPMGNGSYTPSLFSTDFGGRTCIGNADVLFNPVVLHKIILPNSQSYTFTYTVYGEIDKIVLPTGGYEKFEHSFVPPVSSPLNYRWVYAQANRGVVRHTVSATGSGTDEVQWLYSSANNMVTMNAPDGSRTESNLWADGANSWGYSVDGARAGRPYDERLYSSSGQMLRRKLTQWAMTGSNASGNPSGPEIANRNARIVKEIDFILDTGGGPALAKTKIYSYDLTYQFSVGIDQTVTNEFDYLEVDQNTAQTLAIGSVPTFATGTLLRTTEIDYLTTNASYRDRNLLGFPTATRVKNGSGTIIAQSSSTYDETAFPLLNYAAVLNWTDPSTTVRANVTSSSRWLNFNGTSFFSFPSGLYVVTHTQFDQCGSPRVIYDARDTGLLNPTLIDYSSTFHRAYPTTNTTPDPDGAGPLTALTTSTEYDLSTGLVTATVDANNQRTTFAYVDSLNRITQVVSAETDSVAKTQTSYAYDDAARTVTVTSDLNAFNDNLLKIVTFNDNLGRPKETRQFESPTTFIATLQEYDDFGRPSKKSNPYRPPNESPVWTITAYDALNRVISVTTPDTAVLSTVYSGNQVLTTDQSGRQQLSRADALGRISEVWEIRSSDSATEAVSFPNHAEVTAGYVTRYSYDLLGNLTAATQRIGTAGTTQTRSFNYDSLRRLISAVNPENGTISYRYDNNGNLTDRTDSRVPAVTLINAYDALNRITSRAYSDGTPTVSYGYDVSTVQNANAKGRLTSISSSVSSYSYLEYDAQGHLRSGKQTTDGQDYTMTYGYDLAGNMKSEGYPSGRVVLMGYDPAGRLAGVQNQATGLFYAGAVSTDATNRIQYSAHGAVSKMKLGNTLWEHTDFNLRLQPTQIGLGSAATNSSVLQLDYNYGTSTNNGTLQSHTITIPGLTLTQVFTYDALNRLETANESGGASWKQKYIIDRYGNRRIDPAAANTSADLVGPNPVFSDLTNRIVPQTGEQYLYDGTGNLTRGKNGETYAFDGENRITSFNGGAPAGANYSYDGNGRRVKKVAGTTTTVFVYDAMGQLLAEYSSAAAGAAGTSYLTSDNLGSPRVITDGSGAVKARHDYHPFGEEIGLRGGRNADPQKYVGDAVRQKFNGKERDAESGFDYFGARYYASLQGRFTSCDPALTSGNVADPQTWNRYSYVLNNPLILIDPDGLYVFDRKVSTEEQERFNESLKKAREYLKTLKEGSEDYLKLSRALAVYGEKGEKNGVKIFSATQEGSAEGGHVDVFKTKVSEDNPGGYAINITMTRWTMGEPDGVAHEGSHAADGKDWAESGFKEEMRPNYYQSEFKAWTVGVIVRQVMAPNERYSIEQPWSYKGRSGMNYITLYDPAWAKSGWTEAAITAERANGINTMLSLPKEAGGYGLTPKSKEKLWQKKGKPY